MSELFRQKGMFVVWFGPVPVLFLTSPETVEPVLKSNNAAELSVFFKYFRPWLGKGLPMSTGENWQRQRKLLNTSFHIHVLENFLPVMNEQAAILVEKIQKTSVAQEFLDSFLFCSECTLDIICETAMGTKINAQTSDSTFTKMLNKTLDGITQRTNRPWFHADMLFFRSKYGKEFQNAVDYLHHFSNKVVADRMSKTKNNAKLIMDGKSERELEPTPKKRLALLDLLLESGLSQLEIRDHVNSFIFAGSDTTGTVLGWMTYLLGLHPEVQDKLAQEVDEVFAGDNDRSVTQDDIRNLKYMDMVIKESIRIYSPAPMFPKKLHEDTEIGGHLIPKGTECILSYYSVQRHPDHFPDPEKFDPDRFKPEKNLERHPYAFVPFSSGQKNCLGQKFAMLEMKIICCHIVRRFRIESLDPPDKIVLLPTVILRPDKDIRLKFIPRIH